VLGWGALLCSLLLLLYGRYETITILAKHGLSSYIGSDENTVIMLLMDIPVLLVAILCIVLSRVFLGKWKWQVISLNLVIFLVVITQYIAAFNSHTNLNECGKASCDGMPYYALFWKLLAGE